VRSFALTARPPSGEAGPAPIERDPDVIRSRLEDAAHFPGGHATELATPESEAQLADLLRKSSSVLPVGAQSSLTGGATPMGETIISTARLKGATLIGPDRVRVGAGVSIAELDREMARAGRYYPPAPTFDGAFVGGTIATNAAGAATFKYGPTRKWVEALTVVLPSGDVLDIERGVARADEDGHLDLHVGGRTIGIDVPRYRLPDVPKVSAGYWTGAGMDLIDLFIGSEGTLGIVTAATLRVLPERPSFCLVFVPFADRSRCMALVADLREQAQRTWRGRDPRGIDISAIEHMDARSLELLKEDGIDRANGVRIPDGTAMALLLTLELPPRMRGEDAYDEIGRARQPSAPDTPLARLIALLAGAGVLDAVEIAVPGDQSRAAQLLAVREGVPAAVNARVGRARRARDPRIEKTAADMIVPFEQFERLLSFYEHEFAHRGLDAAVWGHISDGNVHPNVIPRSYEDVESGRAAILVFAREVLRMGGAPLAEHGVGRSRIKQELLRMMYGEAGIDAMRRVKRAIDPEWKLSPGVLFGRTTASTSAA
jgi:D-lactate dehydrogenase (cytochrome)